MDPAIGSTVVTAPDHVSLTFGEEVKSLGSTVVVLDPNGNAVQVGDLAVDGAVATIGLAALATTGDYHVNFRIVSADGHVVTGSEVFTFTNEAPTPTLLTASPEVSEVTSTSTSVGLYITGLLIAVSALAAFGIVRSRHH